MLTKGHKQQFKTQCLFGSQPMIQTKTGTATSRAVNVAPQKSPLSSSASISVRATPRTSATQMMAMNYKANSLRDIP